ncbi:sRNA-binding protein [Rhizobium petrolearium]|uniref:ProQ/FINO family protein n=2 Tax=Neorhizobium TaxID=1525371 RepID=A0ABV0MCJ2_9HYPH|nr:ProQ/FINO family protein [Neorhizobium petrolearium]MBP1848330.1 sRNA-binding protein [Neorhizobium petrolearium]MCC2614550.1 ProQ/FinO family protein [Neorhizobium petrolearium]WGI72309.1 ProQ/FINO family protein [Neorhizobium petrolearium]
MDKPWTISCGPIAATDADIRKAEVINSLLTRPIGILPAAPGDPIRPFAIGLFDEIRPLLKPDVGVTRLRRAVGAFVHTRRYYFASAQPDSMRHDIDGNPVEPLSAADRLVAQKRFLSLKRRDVQDHPADAETAPPPPPNKTDRIRATLLGGTSAMGRTVS